MRPVGLEATASYLPERVFTAAELAAVSGIPEDVLVEKFGIRSKHIAAPDEHATDLAVEAGEQLLRETGFDPLDVDVVMYFGSTWKDWAVWQAAPHIAYRLGCRNAWAMEYDNVSHGSPVALRVGRDVLRAEPETRSILMVAACRESYLLDYGNERSRFTFNFGDGAVAGLLLGGDAIRNEVLRNEVLGAHTITDGSFSLHVRVARGGSIDPDGYPSLDVIDPEGMKEGLDPVTMANFMAAAEGALERSGLSIRDVSYLCPLHMKRSMFHALLERFELPEGRACYLDDTGHMSGVDSMLGLDRAAREGKLAEGDIVLLLSAGTGYSWAASVVRWGPMR